MIGTVFPDQGWPYPLVPSDAGLQQIWGDYIKTHNDRDFEKIADINAEDRTGHPPDGTVIKGNTAQGSV